MEHHGITEIELWDYILKHANAKTMCKVEAWMDSPDFDKNTFSQLIRIHKHVNGVEAIYNFDTAKERLMWEIELKTCS